MHEELQELRKTVAARPENNGSAYDADGYFLGTEDEKIRHRQLFDYIGITSRQEMAREDRSATAWTQAIAIVGGALHARWSPWVLRYSSFAFRC